MKKIKYLILFLFTSFLITGCGNTSKEEVETALKNMKELKSSTVEVKTEVGSSEYAITTQTTTDLIKGGNVSHSTTKMDIYGTMIESESYTEKEGDTLYTYTSDDGGVTWTYTEEESKDTTSDMDSINRLTENYKSIKKVKSNRSGETKYELTIDKSIFNDAITENEEDPLELEKDVILTIYIKKGYITTMEMNLLDVVDAIKEEGISVYKMTFNISNHNQVDEIKVPEDIKKKATLMEEEE